MARLGLPPGEIDDAMQRRTVPSVLRKQQHEQKPRESLSAPGWEAELPASPPPSAQSSGRWEDGTQAG